MIDATPLARRWLHPLVRQAALWQQPGGVEQAQRRQLAQLLQRGAKTAYGHLTGLDARMTPEQFAADIPIAPYDTLRPLVMRMIQGEKDVLWPGRVTHFAQSSGTSDGRSKYIPVTREAFSQAQYRGAAYAVAHYLDRNPQSSMFRGKGFILGGSYANTLSEPVPRGVVVGDLSANLIDRVPAAVNLFRIPDKATALMADWTEKLPRLVEASARQRVTNISGVPSWFLTVLRAVMASRGAATIHDVWEGLEVFFHGGISMQPYREAYAAITRPGMMQYVETYNASEGFFAAQLQADPAQGMTLLLDTGTYYELGDPSGSLTRPLIPVWQAEEGRTYALYITSCNGLWRYPIGDTVRIHSLRPLRITVAGRTRHYINAFGEEVMVHNTDQAVAEATRITGLRVKDYTVGPRWPRDGQMGCHEWVIEFDGPALPSPQAVEAYAEALDAALRRANSDYDAKRTGDIFMARLRIRPAAVGTFDRYLLRRTGALGGQRKVPRLSPDRSVIDVL